MRNIFKKINNKSGIVTLEILLAMFIIIMAISTVILLVSGGQDITVGSQTNQEALYKAQKQIEGARATARMDFNDPTLSNSTEYDTSGITYTKKLTIEDVADFTKKITSLITWETGQQVALSTIVTDWSGASGICNPQIADANKWKFPEVHTLDTKDLVQLAISTSANGLGVSDLKVYNKKLYLAANITPASDPLNASLYIFDLPNNPSLMLSYKGRASTTGAKLNAVTVAPSGSDLYAYVANAKSFNFTTCVVASNCPQFQVIKVTNSTSPTLVSTANLKMPGVTGTGGQGIGKSIFYYKNYVYLGLVHPASGPEFNVIDVHNPELPVRVGGYTIGTTNSTINSIYVKGDYAYLATTDNVAGNKQLLILDISDKTNPHLVTPPVGGFFSPSGDGYGYAVSVVGDKVYLGRSYSSTTVPNFYILDNTNPASYPFPLSVLDSKNVGSTDNVNAIIVRDYLVFLLTKKEFQIWNTSGSLASWASLSLASIDSKINGSSASNCSGNYIYAALQTSLGTDRDYIAIITPKIDSTYTLGNSGDISIAQGSSGNTTITRTRTSGFPTGETLTASGLPAGASYNLSNNPCTPNCSGILTITTTGLTPNGLSLITINGTSGVLPTKFNLNVSSGPFDYSLNNSGDINIHQNSSGFVTITSSLLSGVAQPVSLTTSPILPASISLGFDNNPCSPNTTCSNKLTISPAVDPTTKNQTYAITVTGAPSGSGGSTTFNLKVQP